jgi:hypothetical protein
MIFSEAPVF